MSAFDWPIPTSVTDSFDSTNSIVFRSAQSTPVLGEFLSPGDHITKEIVDRGYPASTSYGIILEVYGGAIKVWYQDGTPQVFLRTEYMVQLGVYAYAVGSPVWYSVFDTTPKEGVVVNFTGQHPDYTSFTIRDTSTGVTSTVLLNNMVLRASAVGIIPQYDCMYNARTGL